tara:strand:- start:146 stop:595 length:450 start_codon:yes stop_codon:yes gene_type:complete
VQIKRVCALDIRRQIVDTTTATTGIRFSVDEKVLADAATTVAHRVVDTKHALEAATDAFVEAEKEFLGMGIEEITLPDGNTVKAIHGVSRSIDIDLLRGLVDSDLFDRVTKLTASIGSLDREVKDGRTTDKVVAPAITEKPKKSYVKVN